MKDYYRILQVHNEAEKEVIEAAYRQLMRKHHPDVLPAERRNDPEVLQKAKEINEAFEILGDADKRAEYDATIKPGELRQDDASTNRREYGVESDIYEKSFLFVRCSQTKDLFKGFLVREQNATTLYTLIGFERAPDYLTRGKTSIFKKLSFRLTNNHSKSLTKTHNFLETNTLTEEDIHKRLNEPPNITMGDINWGPHTCPSCAGSIQNANGTMGTWIGCSKCGHIRCAGGVKETNLGKFSTCPWCGKTNQLTRSVKPGNKDKLQLHGIKKQRGTEKKLDKLGEKRKSIELPEGDK